MQRPTFGLGSPWKALVAGLLAGAVVAGCNCDVTTRPVNPTIVVNPVAIDFGKVAVGASAEQLVDVRNTGSGGLDIKTLSITTPARTSTGADEVALAKAWATDCAGNPRDPNQLTIEGGGCARFAVRYVPLEVHAINAVVTIASSDAEHATVEIPVTGAGVSSKIKICVLTAAGAEEDGACTHFDSPDPATAARMPEVDFGSAPIGDTVTRKVRVHNDGEGQLVISSAHIESDFPDFSVEGDRYSGTVDAGQTVDVALLFKPQGDGPETGKLLVATNDQAHASVELPLKAEAQGPRLCVLPETGLDFGSMPVGASRKLTLNLKNCGFVKYDFTTLEFHEDAQVNPVNFAVTAPNTIPGTPHAFAPGDEINIDLTYKPTAVAKNTGYFTVVTDFQHGRIPVIGEGAPANCGGAIRPVAVIKVKKGTTDITANPKVQPLDTVTFDGSASTAARGGPKYKWRLVSQPQNGTQNVTPRSNPSQANLFAELDGDYVVELVVGDQYGCDSDPKQVTVHVVSNGKVHVQLTWSQSFGDVDLHFLGPGGTMRTASDCYYGNCEHTPDPLFGLDMYSVDWGANNTTQADRNHGNDPTLDIDALWGNGPENITDENPFDATYTVLVHYYCSRQNGGGRSMGAATATVRIFVNGVQQYTATQSLTQRDKWSVATVQVTNGGTTIQVHGTGAITKSTADKDACTADTN